MKETLAAVVGLVGLGLVIGGVGMIYLPLALISAGAALLKISYSALKEKGAKG